MKIDSDVKIPEFVRTNIGSTAKYPFRAMRVGDSIFMGGKDGEILSAAARKFAQRNPEWAFIRRTVCENGVVGIRVWRVDRG